MAVWTVVVSLAMLLVASRSEVVLVTVTLFMTSPSTVGTTRMVTAGLAPAAMDPRLHVTAPGDLVHVPCVDVAETKVTLPGSVSVSTTSVEVSGPLFVTVIV